MSTHASLIPKSIQEAIKLRDQLQDSCRPPVPEVNRDLLDLRKGLSKKEYTTVAKRVEKRLYSVRNFAVASSHNSQRHEIEEDVKISLKAIDEDGFGERVSSDIFKSLEKRA